ncbi:hypothetical protein KAR91_38790 [Candidatus Pacearchaeota archaeon]|nr:hypothetical protein [Candidatus Pacearchaeota archaeon]
MNKNLKSIILAVFLILILPFVVAEEGVGCCIDEDQGKCSPNSIESECDEYINGVWNDDALCESPQCERGCCSIGYKNEWITGRACEKQGELAGIAVTFDNSISDEIVCYDGARSMDLGACVIEIGEARTCGFTSDHECYSRGGRFFNGELCSKESLDAECERQSAIGVIDGREEIYWFDSCGNPENIYSSDKDASWNEGLVLSKNESCNPTSSNSESSTCGNCNLDYGSAGMEYEDGIGDTKMEDGDFTCRDLNCKDAPIIVSPNGEVKKTEDKINGESWCVYDASVGTMVGGLGGVSGSSSGGLLSGGALSVAERALTGGLLGGTGSDLGNFFSAGGGLDAGLGSVGFLAGSSESGSPAFGQELLGAMTLVSSDVVGSRHFRYICSNGEIDVEPCADYRKEICAEKEKEEDGKTEAFCRINMWDSCMSLNGQSGCGIGCIPGCLQNPDCRVHPVVVSDNFKFNVCVPKYPPGSKISNKTLDLAPIAEGYASSLFGGGYGGALNALTGGDGGSAGDVCRLASQTCTTTWVKECSWSAVGSGGWTCIENCECHDKGFTKQMNNLCVSMGDCGVYTNIKGTVTSLLGSSVFKKGSKGKTPPQPLVLAPIYIVAAKLELGSKPIPAEDIEDIEGINALNFLEGTDLLGGGYARTHGKGWDKDWWDKSILEVLHIFGCGKTKKIEINFDCRAWTQPAISNCDFCNDNRALKPCSRYRCESLGACELINEDTGFDECIKRIDEIGIPVITPWEEILNDTFYHYEDITEDGFKTREIDGDCIQAYSPLVMGVQTDIQSQCRLALESKEFKNMTIPFFEGALFTRNHTISMILPSVAHLTYDELDETAEDSEGDEPGVEIRRHTYNDIGEMSVHIKCADIEGTTNEEDYIINLCVDQGPDTIPPYIASQYTSPANEDILSFLSTNETVIMYASEPSECRWSQTKPVEEDLELAYLELENELECNTDPVSGDFEGWKCNAMFPVNESYNEYFVMCRDQPWLPEGVGPDGEKRNVGDIFEYSLYRSESELKVGSVTPSGKIIFGTEPARITLRTSTSGGGYSGRALCGFSKSEIPAFADFNNEIEPVSSHEQEGIVFAEGAHNINIKCTDLAGNEAYGNTSIEIEFDKTPPQVVRVFSLGGLKITTDEEAECFYNVKTCNFDIKSGISMTTVLSETHNAPWDPSTIYHVKCMDVWENQEQGCLIVVRPSEI